MTPEESKKLIEEAVSFAITGPPRAFFEWQNSEDETVHFDYDHYALGALKDEWDTESLIKYATEGFVGELIPHNKKMIVWRAYPDVREESGKLVFSMRLVILDEDLQRLIIPWKSSDKITLPEEEPV